MKLTLLEKISLLTVWSSSLVWIYFALPESTPADQWVYYPIPTWLNFIFWVLFIWVAFSVYLIYFGVIIFIISFIWRLSFRRWDRGLLISIIGLILPIACLLILQFLLKL